jgi:hypothetical protein
VTPEYSASVTLFCKCGHLMMETGTSTTVCSNESCPEFNVVKVITVTVGSSNTVAERVTVQ